MPCRCRVTVQGRQNVREIKHMPPHASQQNRQRTGNHTGLARQRAGTSKRSAPTWKGQFVIGPKAGGQAQHVITKFQWLTRGGRGMRSMPAATAYALRYMEKGDRGHEAYALYQAQDQAIDKHDFAARTRQDPHQWHVVFQTWI